MNFSLSPHFFAGVLVDRFQKRAGVFSNKLNAEDWVPKDKHPREQALFLFYVVLLDYAIKSQGLYEGATRLLKHKPNFFEPRFILGLGDKKILEVISEYLKPRYPNEAVLRYKLNSHKLLGNYKGDPLKIFAGHSSAKETLARVLEFRGMGPKTGNLFFRSMVSCFNFRFPDIEDILPPVDMHDVRIAYLLGFVKSDKTTDENVKKVKVLWSSACKEAGVDWITFDRGLWLLGSQERPKSKEEICDLLGIEGASGMKT